MNMTSNQKTTSRLDYGLVLIIIFTFFSKLCSYL